MPKTASLSFSEHLAAACRLPLNLPVFLRDYQHVLTGVAASGRFELHGLTIDAPPGVYSPHASSSTRAVMDRFSALGLNQSTGRLLEVGCGAGAISLLAARLGWSVSAGDVDPVAVRATQDNAKQNRLRVDARVSDLFTAFAGEKFDVIVFNQPFFHLDRETREEERTLADFRGELHARFMAEAKKHLTPQGYLVFTYSNCSNPDILDQPGWQLALRAFEYDATSNYVVAIFIARPS